MAQSVEHPILGFGMISRFRGFEPRVRLCADSAEPAWDSLSLSLCPSPAYAVSLSLKINKLFFFNIGCSDLVLAGSSLSPLLLCPLEKEC